MTGLHGLIQSWIRKWPQEEDNLFIEIIFVFLGNSLVRSVITDVRLVGGPTPDRGTVELRLDGGTWETTRGVNLGINDVIVICRQLGFAGASRAITDTPYGQKSFPIRALICNGDESDLSECLGFSVTTTCTTSGAATCHGEGYLGCFEDESNDRVFPGDNFVADPDMTISYCIQFCNESNRATYKYAGVENGNECFCGEASDNYTRHGVGSDANCQIPCSGDPTESCGGTGYISIFEIFDSAPPPTTVGDTSPTTYTSTTTSTSTFASTSRHVDVNTEKARTLAVGILLAFVTLYGIIITLMYLYLRRSNIALKQSVGDREGQELDPYTSLDATTMKQPAYEDIKATRQGDRGHTNAIEGVEYENKKIVKQTARVKESYLGVADENTEPEYELPMEE